MRDLGIVRHKHWLMYGYKHGFLLKWPMPIKSLIVTVWNFVACRLFGHDVFGIPEEGVDYACSNCCKKFPEY